MIYEFSCDYCNSATQIDTRPFRPPKAPTCEVCGKKMLRVYGCRIDTSGCKDPDDIPGSKQIAFANQDMTGGQANSIERGFQKHNEATRKELADGGNRGSFRKTMQIPANLYHGKIKQTGDREYWDDPKNRNRHKSCKVD